jgi:hypothetical protein
MKNLFLLSLYVTLLFTSGCKYVAYLAAAVFYYQLLGDDPRNIPAGNSSAAAGLGITEEQAKSLHETAYNAVKNN